MRWTSEQVTWIVSHYGCNSNRRLAEMATEEFGFAVTPRQMQCFGSNHHLRKVPGQRSRSLRESSFWDEERDQWLRDHVPGHTQSETVEAFRERFGVPLSLVRLKNRKVALGLRSGIVGGRVRRGMAPSNKGRKWDEYMSPEGQVRSRTTQYHHGNLPHNTAPLGTERVTDDGYVEVKVAMRPSGRKAHDNWVPKHRLVWERANGRPVPEGSVVVFLDGDKRNLDPANLGLETRAEHAVMARNHITYTDRVSHDVALAIARLRMASARAGRNRNG